MIKKDARIDVLRKKITAVDKKLMRSLDERFAVAQEIGAYKRLHELPVEDPHLEIRKRRDRNTFLHKQKSSHARDIEIVFRTIVQISRAVQRRDAFEQSVGHPRFRTAIRTKIAVMGSKGSFTEEAGLAYCKKNHLKNCSLLYPVSAEGVLHLLEVEQADIGIFPIFNSSGGIVYESIYAASEHIFSIDEIFPVDIRQCLMALPGTAPQSIKTIMSHPQALAQCKSYLSTHFPHAKLIEASDTATAAEHLSKSRNKKDLAVIAPRRCANLYKLALLKEGIQDLKHNLTYFIAAVM